MTIKTIGLVGGGVIGAGWAARFLLNGYDVRVFDPDPDVARKLEAVLSNARLAQAKLMPGLRLPEGHLSVVDAIAGLSTADFIQENLPEMEGLKQSVLRRLEDAVRPDVVIASSTSGLLPTRLQSVMAHPGRLVVGHPVYLLPLVEICGGEQTVDATKASAASLYEHTGMRPLHVHKEIDGFVADRLLEALWREALWLVNDGIATTEEIDDAVRFGAGLRWSFMGTFLTYRLAGGEAGMRHFLAQFGPALKLPWTKLEAPELTQALIDRVASQSDDQAAGVSMRELERKRDDCLVAVLGGLRAQDYGAGAVLKRFERAAFERMPPLPAPTDEAPITFWRGRVQADWIDYNGHMTEHRYLQCFGEATDAMLRQLGVDQAYLASHRSFYTVETHLMHHGQAKLDAELEVSTQVLFADGKRLHVFHCLRREGENGDIATAEQMLLHVDTEAGRAIAAQGSVLLAIEHLATSHGSLARPALSGRRVGEPKT